MTNAATYQEPIGRFVVEYLERPVDARHAAELRINGIDPDDNWLLEYSTECPGNAEEYKLAREESGFGRIRRYRVRDRGEAAPRTIERAAWF